MSTPTKLIFLPGAGGNPHFWQPVADLLIHPATHAFLGWPGFGAVPMNPNVHGIQDLVALVVNEIDQPSALIAQSMGGVIAIQAALERPDLVTHLVLTVTSGGVDISDLKVEDWRPAFIEANPTFPRWFSTYQEDLTPRLSKVTMPTLLLWGDTDPISPVRVGERLASLLPCARLHIVQGGDHDLAETHAHAIALLIDEHLAIAT